ncbi:GntR family transcriptional regulator [Acinetobacter calcoaceticus]|uniref:GntR family transcriptional regulator n=1 Tax=Acinetobacter calcoaceticus TaxID=471 RepID=A0A4R1XRG9_ACICA|nr:GntR family transcriptional regulator [Acinetobacter calcoaceticus]
MTQNEFIQLLSDNFKIIPEKKLRTKLYLAIKKTLTDVSLPQAFKCPSTRFLSETLGISRDTVEKTYAQFEQEGIFYRIKGKGSFIKTQPSALQVDAQHQLIATRHQIEYDLPANTEKLEALFFDQNLNFFADGMPEIRNFPFKKWYETEKFALSQYGLSIFLKDNGAGDALLRHEIAQFINLNRHTQVNAEQVLIVNSTQQGLYLCAQVLFNRGDHIVLENPYYSNAYHLFDLAGLEQHCVNLDDQGLDLQQAAHISNIKALYLTPASQYPSGIQMSLARKQQLIEFAEQRNSYIIEDDYDALMLHKENNPAILGLDHYQRTIYLGSFSKYLLPSLRMSYIILPMALIEPFKRYRNYIDGCAPSQYFQVILANFMQRGYYAEYLVQMQQLYAQRYQTFMHCFELYLADYCYLKEHQPTMQIACYFKADIPISLEKFLVQAAEVREIYITRLSQFYAQDPEYGFVLGFSSLNQTEIKACMLLLRQLIDNELARLPI